LDGRVHRMRSPTDIDRHPGTGPWVSPALPSITSVLTYARVRACQALPDITTSITDLGAMAVNGRPGHTPVGACRGCRFLIATVVCLRLRCTRPLQDFGDDRNVCVAGVATEKVPAMGPGIQSVVRVPVWRRRKRIGLLVSCEHGPPLS
jgi:hypothetical protein